MKRSEEENDKGDECMNLSEFNKVEKGNLSRVIGEDEAKNGKPLASIMAGRRCGVNNLCGGIKKKKIVDLILRKGI